MAGIKVHSASPLSSNSSQQSLHGDSVSAQALQASEEGHAPQDGSKSILEGLPKAESESQNSPGSIQSSIGTETSQLCDKPLRHGPRINTSLKSTSTNTPLPWKIDETSSPSTPAAQARRASFAPPPRNGHRGSTDYSIVTSPVQALPALSTASCSHPNPYEPSTASPYVSSPNSNSHLNGLNYAQNNAQHVRSSFSNASANFSPYANSSPFYYNYSYSSSISSPITPTRRGRGILDNDPDIYLRGEGDGEEETYWDTAAKWARAAGKRLSAGEQTIWRMVNAVANGEDDR